MHGLDVGAEFGEQGARDGVSGGGAVEREDCDAPGVRGGDGAEVDERRGGRGGVGPLCGEAERAAEEEEEEWGAHCWWSGGERGGDGWRSGEAGGRGEAEGG